MSEQLVRVDLFDNEIGYGEKMEIHMQHMLHRAFSIFIVHDEKMLLQRRSLNKYHSGGLWANACCSHPRKGEEMNEALARRLKEELNIECKIKEIFSFVYYKEFDSLTEFEYDHVYIGDYSGDVVPNASEIQEIKWIKLSELKNELEKNPQDFCSWFLIAAPRVIQYLTKREFLS